MKIGGRWLILGNCTDWYVQEMVWNIMHGVDLETAKATSLEKRVRHSKNSDERFCFLPFSLRRRWELIALPSPYS